jgi:hypothetical protein
MFKVSQYTKVFSKGMGAPLFFSLICTGGLLGQGENASGVRRWTNQQGQTVDASFGGLSDDKVVLKLQNGTVSHVALDVLSKADQDFIQSLQGKAGATSISTLPATPLPGNAVLNWPPGILSVDPKTVIVVPGEQKPTERKYYYRTDAFEFIANAPLAGSVVSEIATDFELVRKAFTRMPWGWEPKPLTASHFQIYLTETDDDYIAMGGDDRSSASSKNDKTFIKFRALGLKKVGSRYQYDSRLMEPGRVTSLTTRVMLWDVRSILLPWSLNGMENFMRHIAYQNNGTMKFQDLETALKKEIKIQMGYGAQLNLPGMLRYLREDWNTRSTASVMKIQLQYKLDAMLLLYYFGYLDGDGTGTALHRYYSGAFQGTPDSTGRVSIGGRSRSPYAIGKELLDELLAGRDDAALTAEMDAKFQGIGLKFAK